MLRGTDDETGGRWLLSGAGEPCGVVEEVCAAQCAACFGYRDCAWNG
ncbi:hypothetical protein [uncultured Merdimonas sp.]